MFLGFHRSQTNETSKEQSFSSPWFWDEYALRLKHPVFGAADSSDKVAGLTFRQLGMVNRRRHLP